MPPDHPLLLDVAPEVARALGAASVLRLRADPALDEYVCCICDQPARACNAAGASVIAVRYTNGLTLARLAHSECSASALLTVLGSPALRRHTVRATCALTASGYPVLQLINDVRAWPRAGARQAADHHTRALTANGFTPLSHGEDVTAAPVVPGLTVDLATPPGTRLLLNSPAGLLFDGVLDPLAGWRDAVHRRGRIIVIADAAGAHGDSTLAATAGFPHTRRGVLHRFLRHTS